MASSLHPPSQPQLKLSTVLVLPFILQMLLAVGLIGSLSFRNSQRAVEDLAQRLQQAVAARVDQELTDYLNTPQVLNLLNVGAHQEELIDLNDQTSLARYFYQQMQIFPDISYVNFSTPTGVFTGIGRNETGLYLEQITPETPELITLFDLDQQGNPVSEVETIPYNPLEDDWYADAVAAGQPLWSDIYQWDDQPEVFSISTSYPLYQDEQLLGVFGADLILSQFNQFLQNLAQSIAGQILIIERDGLIVATSITDQAQPTLERVALDSHPSPLIQATGQALASTLASPQSDPVLFRYDGQRHFAQVIPWQDTLGLDWLIVVVVPESSFITQINQNNWTTVILGLLLCGLVTMTAIYIVRKITQPLSELNRAAKAVTSGQTEYTLPETSAFQEFSTLFKVFNQMTRDLNQKSAQVNQALTEATQELNQRARQAVEDNENLQQEVRHLLKVVSEVEEGDLTAQAEIGPFVTGLVADTFNRLVTQLRQILSQVLDTAQQVTQRSKALEDKAKEVTSLAVLQAEQVAQILDLTDQVETYAQDSATTAEQTSQALFNVRYALDQGQSAIANLSNGITVLKSGSNRIVDQTQALGEFALLADEFVQEQAQVASLTQMLSMSANLIAARAKEQKDPKQFLSLAMEFEAIAKQVGDLANQTNAGLGPLQQRTTQVQEAVAVINEDIENLAGLVEGFTVGVDQSTEVFSHVSSVSEDLSLATSTVAESSQSILGAAQATAQAVRDIADLANRTAELTQSTQQQSEQMEELSEQLLQRIQFFRLSGAGVTDNGNSSIDPTTEEPTETATDQPFPLITS